MSRKPLDSDSNAIDSGTSGASLKPSTEFKPSGASNGSKIVPSAIGAVGGSDTSKGSVEDSVTGSSSGVAGGTVSRFNATEALAAMLGRSMVLLGEYQPPSRSGTVPGSNSG